jgi:hypothetical protein
LAGVGKFLAKFGRALATVGHIGGRLRKFGRVSHLPDFFYIFGQFRGGIYGFPGQDSQDERDYDFKDRPAH